MHVVSLSERADLPCRRMTWPKLAGLIEILKSRDTFFVDSDVAFKRVRVPAVCFALFARSLPVRSLARTHTRGWSPCFRITM